MHRFVCIFTASACLLLCPIHQSFAADGFAVSVAWRYGQLNWGPAPSAPESGDFRGALLRYDITNNAVTNVDTIIKRSTCIVHGGAVSINLEGSQIAFFRWKNYLDQNGDLQSTGQSYVSVVDKDGTNLRDLTEIEDPSDADNNAMDWPVGDWIYYVRPMAGANPWDRRSRDVWRVNANTSANEKVSTIVENTEDSWWIRRFSLSIDGTKMCLQNGSIAGSHLSCFPPPPDGDYRSDACNVFEFGACNGSVGASGKYTLSYKGWHNLICFSTWMPSLPGPSSVQTQTDVTNWAGGAPVCPPQPSGNPPNCNDCGGEWMHWSVNSDKWSSHWPGTCQHADGMRMGTNYVLLNWIDSEAILLTRYETIFDPSPGGSGVISYGEYGGDFWVDGGPANAGKYEDVDGVWHTVEGATTRASVPVPAYTASVKAQLAPEGITIALPQRSCSVDLVDMQGRCVFAGHAFGGMLIPRAVLRRGTYAVVVDDGTSVIGQKVIVHR